MKIYGEILAGGKGERMGLGDLPKQFFMLGEKPVIIHTIEKFIQNKKIDEIIVVVKSDYEEYLKSLIDNYFKD